MPWVLMERVSRFATGRACASSGPTTFALVEHGLKVTRSSARRQNRFPSRASFGFYLPCQYLLCDLLIRSDFPVDIHISPR